MPRYDYRCEACELSFESVRSINDSSEPAECPQCSGHAARQFSPPLATYTTGTAAERLRNPPGGLTERERWSAPGHGHGHTHTHDGSTHSH